MSQTQPNIETNFNEIHSSPLMSPIAQSNPVFSIASTILPQDYSHNEIISTTQSPPTQDTKVFTDKPLSIVVPPTINELKDYCQYKRDLHYICSKYYEKWQIRFQVPSIFITSISGIMSFFATSSIFSEESVRFLSLLVGVSASCSAVVQAVSNIFDFGNKASSHEYAVMSYEQILTKIRFMILKPNADAPGNIEEIERLIFELKQRVKYITPSWAEEKYKQNKHKLKNSLIKMEKDSLLIENKFKEMVELETLKLKLFENNIKSIKNFDELKDVKI